MKEVKNEILVERLHDVARKKTHNFRTLIDIRNDEDLVKFFHKQDDIFLKRVENIKKIIVRKLSEPKIIAC